MKARTIITLTALGAGAFFGGPLGATIGKYIGDFGCSFLDTALGDDKLEQTVSGIFGNLFAGELAEAARGGELSGFNHDFRKAIAQALVKSFHWDEQDPGPVQGILLKRPTYGVASARDRQRLADVFRHWSEHFSTALKALPELGPLEELFPAAAKDSAYLDLTADSSADSGKAPDKLWAEFYDHALGTRLLNPAELRHLSGGAAKLREEVIAALTQAFPAQFAEVIKAPEFKRSWIAFQKTALLASRSEILRLSQSQEKGFAELTKKLDPLAQQIDQLCQSGEKLNRFAESIERTLLAQREGFTYVEQVVRDETAAMRRAIEGQSEKQDQQHQEQMAAHSEHKAADGDILQELSEVRGELVEGFAELGRKLEQRPSEREESLREKTAPASSKPYSFRPPFLLPRAATAGEFLGRDELLKKLTSRLRNRENTFVWGLIGMGKTALAAAAVRAVVGIDRDALATTPFPDGVLVLDLYRLKANLRAVCTALVAEFDTAQTTGKTLEKRARTACKGRRALVIVEGAEEADGVDGRSDLAKLLSVLDEVSTTHLVLTRNKKQTLPEQRLEIESPLSDSESLELLRRQASKVQEPILRKAHERLGGHPLALTWAGSQLADRDQPPEMFLEELSASKLPQLHEPGFEKHTLKWLFDRSTRRFDRDALAVLRVAGHVAFAELPISLAQSSLEGEGVVERASVALRRLTSEGLLQVVSSGWQFTHQLAYQYSGEFLKPDKATCQRLTEWGLKELQSGLAAFPEAGETESIRRILRHVVALHEAKLLQVKLGSFVAQLAPAAERSIGLREVRDHLIRTATASKEIVFVHANPDRVEYFRQALGELGPRTLVIESADKAADYFTEPRPDVLALLVDSCLPPGQFHEHDHQAGTLTGVVLYEEICRLQMALGASGHRVPVVLSPCGNDSEILRRLQTCHPIDGLPDPIQIWEVANWESRELADHLIGWLASLEAF